MAFSRRVTSSSLISWTSLLMARNHSVFPEAIITKRRYDPVGKCIYCGRPADGNDLLSEEHIIPLSFGGELTLPKASCTKCRDITTRIEDRCVKTMIMTARTHLGIKGRQKLKKRSRLPVTVSSGGNIKTLSVPLEQHPSAIVMLQMPLPNAMSGISPATTTDDNFIVNGKFIIRPVVKEYFQKMNRLKDDVNIVNGITYSVFYQLIAKIAHSFAVAERGLNAFYPTLLPLIEFSSANLADYYIGSGTIIPPTSKYLHEIGFAPDIQTPEGTLIVVKIRLFANFNMPVHYAAVGFRNRNT